MRTFARLVSVLDSINIHLHQSFPREEIPPLFGLEFNSGLWQSGHVCPKDHQDQILFVTLNKQGKITEHQYHDYFVDKQNFHWQSQNSTKPNSKKGKGIIEHHNNGSRVHLFTRKPKLQKGKAAPFIYCGTLAYTSHKGPEPMSVLWELHTPLTPELEELFS